MTDSHEATSKIHYICQTYVEKAGGQGALQVDKLFQYSTASEAEGRATREYEAKRCVGADAYMISEDPSSGEVGPPEFMTRLGRFPEFDAF